MKSNIHATSHNIGKGEVYRRYFKRLLDFFLSLYALIILSPIFLCLAILIKIKLGSPVIFKQKRPGKKDKNGNEKLFTLYKFRTMTNTRDRQGNLLSDEIRLTHFGQKLRDTSLDELPEFLNILKGEMSIIGPRPQLVRDIVYMTPEQRRRHDIRPGLSGWAQINGRNAIEWEDKLKFDLEYLNKISLWFDLKIMLTTIRKVFKTENISYKGMATAEDYGDYLLRTGKISQVQYDVGQSEANKLIKL